MPSNTAMQLCAERSAMDLGAAARTCVFFFFGARISILYRLMRSAKTSGAAPGRRFSSGNKNAVASWWAAA